MEALLRGKRRRGDWKQATGSSKRPASAKAAAAGAPSDSDGAAQFKGHERTPGAGALSADGLARPSLATSPLDEPVPPSESAGDDEEDMFELSLSEDSDDEEGGSGLALGAAAAATSSPTVAEAAAFVAAAVAAMRVFMSVSPEFQRAAFGESEPDRPADASRWWRPCRLRPPPCAVMKVARRFYDSAVC